MASPGGRKTTCPNEVEEEEEEEMGRRRVLCLKNNWENQRGEDFFICFFIVRSTAYTRILMPHFYNNVINYTVDEH